MLFSLVLLWTGFPGVLLAAENHQSETVFLETGQLNFYNTKVLYYRVANPLRSETSFNRIPDETRARFLKIEPPDWMDPEQIGTGSIIDDEEGLSDAFSGYEELRVEGIGEDGQVTLLSGIDVE